MNDFDIMKLMKRLLKIGSGLFIYSLIPILSWILLSIILHDSRISNIFSITYSMQFVYAILKTFFGTAANIRKEKEQDPNAVEGGIFAGIILSGIIFAIPMIFVDGYINFFGQDAQFYRIFVLYSFALLLLETWFSLIIEKMYFEDKEGKANIHMFAFSFTNFAVLILTALISKSAIISICVTLAVLLLYLIVLYVFNIKKFAIDLKFYKNLRYESANIFSHIAMLIIYLFGFKTAFSAGPEYLVALNIVGLCTDTQWDAMDAIATVAKVDISKGRYNFRKELANSYIFTAIMIASSVIMCSVMTIINKASFVLVAAYFAFQVFDMLLHPYKTCIATFTQIEYSPVLSTSVGLTTKTIRTIISVFLISPFCNDIAQIVAGFLNFFIMLMIRCTKYKVVDGKLTKRLLPQSTNPDT